MYFKKPSGNFEEQFYYSQVLEGTLHTQGSHSSEVTGREESGPGALPLLQSKGEVSKVLWVYSLLANLNHKSRN